MTPPTVRQARRAAMRRARRRVTNAVGPTAARVMQAPARTRVELWLSRLPHGHRVGTVCLLVGPYRNLTTLTSAVLALHPNCQVLNHGGDRVIGHPEVDFVSHFSPERLDRFIRYAIRISGGGAAGWFGGTITRSHAFRRDGPSRLYADRYGNALVKDDVRALLWKESMVVTNRLATSATHAEDLLAAAPQLRLLLPIRNPLDCARSNLRTGHVEHLRPRTFDAPGTVDAILDGIGWFAAVRQRHPDQCLWFSEHELGEDLLRRLAAFLGLEPDPRWIDDGVSCFQLDSSYEHPPELIEHYRRSVDERFEGGSDLHRELLRFIGGSAPSPVDRG